MAGPVGQDAELLDPTALHRALRADSGLSAEASDAGEADGWVAAWTPRCWFAPSFSGFWTRPAQGGKGKRVAAVVVKDADLARFFDELKGLKREGAGATFRDFAAIQVHSNGSPTLRQGGGALCRYRRVFREHFQGPIAEAMMALGEGGGAVPVGEIRAFIQGRYAHPSISELFEDEDVVRQLRALGCSDGSSRGAKWTTTDFDCYEKLQQALPYAHFCSSEHARLPHLRVDAKQLGALGVAAEGVRRSPKRQGKRNKRAGEARVRPYAEAAASFKCACLTGCVLAAATALEAHAVFEKAEPGEAPALRFMQLLAHLEQRGVYSSYQLVARILAELMRTPLLKPMHVDVWCNFKGERHKELFAVPEGYRAPGARHCPPGAEKAKRKRPDAAGEPLVASPREGKRPAVEPRRGGKRDQVIDLVSSESSGGGTALGSDEGEAMINFHDEGPDAEEEEASDDGPAGADGKASTGRRITFKAPQNAGTAKLHDEILRFAKAVASSSHSLGDVIEVVEGIEACAKTLWPNSKVFIVGSQATGLNLPGSDIDLGILGVVKDLSKAGSGFSNREKAAITRKLRDLLGLMKNRKIVKRSKVIAKARVPIIKCTLSDLNLPCDISLGASNAKRAVKFVENQIKRFPRSLRPLVLVLKALLAHKGLNEVGPRPPAVHPPPSARVSVAPGLNWCSPGRCSQVFTGGLGSYALLSMLIGHFLVSGDGDDLGRSLLGFLQLYGTDFDYENSAVSIVQGKGIIDKKFSWFEPKRRFALAVEDPQVRRPPASRPP